jgi:hypothetical protein
MAEPAAARVPWWEAAAAGQLLPLAFVKIDRAGSRREVKELNHLRNQVMASPLGRWPLGRAAFESDPTPA